MHVPVIPIWKEAPFVRLVIPFIGGIFVQLHFFVPLAADIIGAASCLVSMTIFSTIKISKQFNLYWIYGVLLNMFMFFSGALVTLLKTGSVSSFGPKKTCPANTLIIAKLEEPLSEKNKTFKAIASVQSIGPADSSLHLNGNIIIYLQKDSLPSGLGYGSTIIFKKTLQPIENTGNPGSFDYKQYCAFQQIYFQIYLRNNEYRIFTGRNYYRIKQFLYATRTYIIKILRRYIPGEKESGLAEALLIGYKDDLDKGLIQAYSNTGVVHVIAISGLHVGLIYWLLTYLLLPLTKATIMRRLKPVIVIAGLWLFSILAGGSPSVLRSALMFTCIVAGESMSRKTSVYNSLAASAFLLLCYNPFWLWDVGFQLSYAAVLSIVIFMKPLYNMFFTDNKILDAIWKLNSVTLAAQILTIPIILYYFHQFPALFLITNLVAVPLSSIILIMELLLCLAFFIPPVAASLGSLSYWMIRLMNWFIEGMNGIPFSVIDEIQLSILQTVLLYISIIFISIAFFHKNRLTFFVAMIALLLLAVSRAHSSITSSAQKMMIVYNIPKHQAVDFIEGNSYFFKGDSVLRGDDVLAQFHLKSSRTLHMVSANRALPALIHNGCYFQFNNKNVVIIETPVEHVPVHQNINVDFIIISRNPRMTIGSLNKIFSFKKIIFDASNSTWNIEKWQAECEKLEISHYSVPEKGAFVMNMN